MRKMVKWILLASMGILLAATLLSGCKKQEGESAVYEAPGTLCRVVYQRANGSVHGDNFDIDLTPAEIKSAMYFDVEQLEYQYLEAVSIESSEWETVKEFVREMTPKLIPVEEPSPVKRWWINFMTEKYQVLDGGDSSSLILSWKTETGQQSIEYQYHNCDHYPEFLGYLKEIVMSHAVK